MNLPKDDIPPWVTDPDIPTPESYGTVAPTKRLAANKEDRHTLHGYIHTETAKAILFEVRMVNTTPVCGDEVNGKKEWFPLSQTHTISQAKTPEDYDYIVVSDWIARTKGIL